MRSHTVREKMTEKAQQLAIDPDDLFLEFDNLKRQSDHMNGRIVSRAKPRYNTYIKKFARDLMIWQSQAEDLISYLIIENEQLKARLWQLEERAD